jgi:uncharacterized protein (DUF2141 family)
LLASGAAAQVQPQCDLTLIAQGVHSDEGSVGFIVFASKEGWPNDYGLSFRRQGVPARTGDVEVVFSAVPPGEYGVVVTHDENGNKQLDRSPSGRPLEGWGMSNDPKGRLQTPAFSKAALQVECGDRIAIRMQYRKKEGGKGSAE